MKYSIIVLLLSILVISACGQRAPISPKEMEEVLSQMFYLDQLIEDEPRFRAQADTTDVYASLLAKYGFTKDDYLNSAAYYLKDPERFGKIFKKAQARLETQEKVLRKKLDDQLAAEAAENQETADKPQEIQDLEETKLDSLQVPEHKKRPLEKVLVDTTLVADSDSTKSVVDSLPEVWVTKEKFITEEDIKALEEKFKK